MGFPKEAPISESTNAKGRGRLRGNHYGNSFYRALVKNLGQMEAILTLSFPPSTLCQQQYFTFAFRLKLLGEGSKEGPATSTTEMKKKTKGKPASVKSGNLYRAPAPKESPPYFISVGVPGLPASPPT